MINDHTRGPESSLYSFFIRIPGTTYIKLFDVWQFVSLFVPFAEVLLHIGLDNLKSRDSNGMTAKRKVKPIVGPNENGLPQIETEQDESEVSQKKILQDENEIPWNTRKLAYVKNFATYGISFLYALFIFIIFLIPSIVNY